ncbi:ATP-dependent DNA helicase At3g02060, chloroplastic [Zea mays]|uniref:ATP-dependent DNA helicase chloroplastic n=2 Tax=Zea mays TaxID=4577 RepID=A0A1D6F697_MAIZE|nr:ATP-dependent DNA helicase At3g02060, chloroplastic [Zea mays]ONM26793.1 ATP-dependent DNA helicase chloroplastic [Zea mays]|eukprot:XP_008670766.1 ATP-dependent DNA helicase At3g02060, chloroplastic [Zea mays]
MAAPPPYTPPAAVPQPLVLLHHPPALVLHVRLRPRSLRLARAPAATATAAAASVAPDDISQLNYRLRAIVRRREGAAAQGATSSSPVDPAQAEAYLRMIRDQQRLGLRQLRREEQEGEGDGDEEGPDGERARKGVAAGSSLGHRVDPRELEPGEYVVHKKVGVGKFACISAEDGADYVFIQYADGMAKLAVDQAARMLYRYNLPHEKRRPRNLSKLNDPSTWEKRRLKGKLAVQKMVVNLMELYLQRMRLGRSPYPKPASMDDFAAEFPYEPTPDQCQAFIDVEKDLTERETPMDRLICGDVGFGKTEVAMRAIFIVVSAGFQAMVLAPTIILAKQHYDVMTERFANYPEMKVAIFSGAQSKEEKDELITMIKNGDLHIIVGTHALLTERMVYSNLGLLVVDEEQKFGVQQKEKIASYKSSIDVLTLSATPIPRTLYLALTGFRDASLMSTPPPERVAVKTYVSAFSKERALSAIKFELQRGGQVFYVVPRIKAIDDVLQFLKDSLPDVPIAVAHGKKLSKNIQLAMEDFTSGKVKILVCTHIIESGIDIAHANTMIIQFAELYGLAQLYQLRGRVGRSGTEGFAYLFYTDKSLLSRVATDRLGAIEEHSELGQGFHVAEKDMGIRGFGSLFGEQQSGDVANVGIDLFFDMLFDSLSKVDQFCLVPVPYKDVQLDINISPRLSSEYISYLENPVELLNEAAKAAEKDLWTLIQFTEDLRRRYGKEPRDMELLLKKLYVRRMAADLGISRIYPSGKMIFMKTNMNKKVFRLMTEAMTSETHRNSLSFAEKEIKAELLVNLPDTLLLNWLFHCLSDCYTVIPALVKY